MILRSRSKRGRPSSGSARRSSASGSDAKMDEARHRISYGVNQDLSDQKMPQKHSRVIGDKRAVWLTENLWRLAAGLPVHRVPIDEIIEFDMNCWFDDRSAPTCRSVARHALKISRA